MPHGILQIEKAAASAAAGFLLPDCIKGTMQPASVKDEAFLF